MNKIFFIGLFASLMACGQSQTSEISGQSAAKPHPLYAFAYDYRPVDGPYYKVSIALNDEGTYTANFHRITPGDGAPISNTIEELGTMLECKEEKTGKKLTTLTCSHDNRPADGLLVEVIVKKNSEKTFDVSVHKSAYGMINTPEWNETTEIASGLVRQN